MRFNAFTGGFILLALSCSVAGGCKKRSPAPSTARDAAPSTRKTTIPANAISGFVTLDITKPAERPCNLSTEIGALGIAAVKRSRYFTYTPKLASSLQVFSGGARVLYMLSTGSEVTPDALKGTLTIGVDLQLAREDPKNPGRQVLESVVRRSVVYDRAIHGAIKTLVRKQVADALAEAIRRAEVQAKSRLLPVATLIARVGNADPVLRDIAIQHLGFRKAKPAVTALIGALKHADRSTVLRAIGALVAVGDRRAVPELIRQYQAATTPTDVRHAIVFALGDLGGAGAQAFLRAELAKTTDDALKKKLKTALQSAQTQ